MTPAVPLLIAAFLAAMGVPVALAQAPKSEPADTAAIEACIKEDRGKGGYGERCYGVIADPCLATPDGKTTAGTVACLSREYRVWDEVLTRTYNELRARLSPELAARLQQAQRAWIESRKLSCEFFWDFIRGTLAGPSVETCFGRETANRALYLQSFLEQTKK